MKRLLAYLIVVISLGLTFSVNSLAVVKITNTTFCLTKNDTWGYIIPSDYNCSKNENKVTYEVFILKFLKNNLDNSPSYILNTLYSEFKYAYLDISLVNDLIDENKSLKSYRKHKKSINKQIAKTEPGQTHLVENYLVMVSGPGPKSLNGKKFYYFASDKYLWKATEIALKKCKKVIENLPNKQSYINYCYDGVYFYKGNYYSKKGDLIKKVNPLYKINFEKALNDFKNEKTQIAKAEPSQTQKVAKKERHICVVWQVSSFLITEYQEGDFDQRCTEKFYKSKNPKLYNKFMQLMLESSASGSIPKNTIISLQTFNRLKGKTQIAKVEPSQTQKVAKKEKKKSKWITKKTTTEDKTIKSKTNKVLEQEKAEITTDKRDNDAPILIVDENITVDSSSYSFIVKAEDKGSEKIFIQVDGVTSEFKDGIFKIDRFSPVDEKIILVAIDQWGNKSKAKTVNIKVDIKDTIVAKKIEKLNPSKLKVKKSRNKVALIIGIEDYSQSPNATFANLDAKYFYEYASKGFGVKKENIKLMIDKEATLIKSIGVLSKWLPSRIKSGETDLIIFFAGHGLASNDGKDLFLLSQDSDPDLLARTALSRTELFKEIIKLNPKSVTMFLDTCYSGVSRDEKTLLASARPVRIIADEQDTPDNFTIFSASQLDQISSGLKDAKHGIFSYYLMKGLEGKADLNKDRNITNGELLAYMDQNVAQKASELGRLQNPSLAGDPDKILMSYR